MLEFTANDLANFEALQKSGASKADLAGLFGASMQFNPYMAGVGAASAAPSAWQAIQQGKLLKELEKRGPQDVTPEAFRKYQALVDQQSTSARTFGEGDARDRVIRRQAKVQGNIERFARNPSTALRATLAANEQAIQEDNAITAQGKVDMLRRKALANQAMLQRGQFQEQGRQEYGKTRSALLGAQAQNWNNFIQGLSGAALNSFVIGAPKKPNELNLEEIPLETTFYSKGSGGA